MLLINNTPFAAERYGLADENGIDLLVMIIKATYRLDDRGNLLRAEKQQPIETADLYSGEPGKSSIKYSSDISFDKPGTDIAVTGFAYAQNGRATESLVSLQVGSLKKTIRVFGDRYWVTPLGTPSISKPQPFDRIPLIYERAFGGVDYSNPDPGKHDGEQRNPVGTGFRAKESRLPLEGTKLPNFEDPNRLIKNPEDRTDPVGLGFISPSWQPRLGFAGTYGEAWEQSRMPLLPVDFNKRFFHSAHPDLIYDGFVRGDEQVRLTGLSAKGSVSFFLPNVYPSCAVETKGSEDLQMIDMKPDKLVLGSEDPELIIVWSGVLRIRKGFQDIRSIQCESQTGG